MMMEPYEIYKYAYDSVQREEARLKKRAEDAYGTVDYVKLLTRWRVMNNKLLFLKSLMDIWGGEDR